MKVLLDEDIDHRLRKFINSHEVFTVRYLGWAGLKNGDLLSIAEKNGMDVFVTADRNLSYQQNLSGRRMAIVVLSAANWPIPMLIVNYQVKLIDFALSFFGGSPRPSSRTYIRMRLVMQSLRTRLQQHRNPQAWV